jgi:hypothetical protein
MSKKEKKQLDQEIKYYEKLNEQQQIDQLLWSTSAYMENISSSMKSNIQWKIVYADTTHYSVGTC